MITEDKIYSVKERIRYLKDALTRAEAELAILLASQKPQEKGNAV